MERKKMSDQEVKTHLSALKDWKADDKNLKKRFEFNNFSEALAFVNKVSAVAEKHDHHPDITFGWGYAKINLTTHDRDGITAFDFAVAKELDAI